MKFLHLFVSCFRRFQALAIQTLKNCHHMDEVQTELLLTKPCPWWGDVSVLQLAIMTSDREFMMQTACKNVMTRIWKGEPTVSLNHLGPLVWFGG